MYIKEISDRKIKVAIPLTNGTGKTRIKKRSALNEYGLPVSTKTEAFTQNCYVEWQIGYDVIKSDSAKMERTSLKDLSFIGANGKEKTLYELSEYIKYFYDWGVVSKEALTEIKTYLSGLSEKDFLDTDPELSIKRSDPVKKNVNGFDFLQTHVNYPLLICRFASSDLVAEIKITEKQYAIGTQPMLYLCFPVTALENGDKLPGRTAQTKETATLVIDESNIGVFLELFKLFGTLSKDHNKDVISIIDVII